MAIHQAQAALYFVLSDFTRARAEGARVLALAQRVGRGRGGYRLGRDGYGLHVGA